MSWDEQKIEIGKGEYRRRDATALNRMYEDGDKMPHPIFVAVGYQTTVPAP